MINEQTRREAIQRIAAAGARWGYALARRGEQFRPPVLAWDAQGKAHVAADTGATQVRTYIAEAADSSYWPPVGGNWEEGRIDRDGRCWIHVPNVGWELEDPQPWGRAQPKRGPWWRRRS